MSLLSRIARAWAGAAGPASARRGAVRAALIDGREAPRHAVPESAVAASDAGTGNATACEADIAVVADAVEALSAEELLARLRAHALGPASPGLVPSEPGHREVRSRATAALARIDACERIPRRPQLLPALMRATGSGDASVKAIATLVQQDPTLTGNVLRVANSAYYRVPGRPLESVERAIARLGTEGMRRIVAATLLQPVTDGRRGAFAGFAPVAWAHSLATAAAAAQYAGRMGSELASTAHLVALVHGLGSIVVMQVVRDEYARRPLLVPDAGVPAALLDSAGAAAARIAAAWELPAPIVGALSATLDADAGSDRIGHALWIGCLAAAAVVLVRAGQLGEATALATMARLDDGVGAAPGIVRRLLDQAHDTG
jgi:HD-like signal output (HDOD) protein